MKGVVKSFSRLKGYGFIQSKELEHEAVYEKRWIVDKPAWDEKAGKYLKYKLVDELTDEEIALKLGVSRRALYGIKPNAYFRIAIWSHQVAYIKESTYEFIFNYAGLYERLK